MNEAETRAEYIAPKLKASGWGVVEKIRRVIKAAWPCLYPCQALLQGKYEKSAQAHYLHGGLIK